MQHPVLVTNVQNAPSTKPILIIDREGTFGLALAKKTTHDFVTILVSALRSTPAHKNLIHVSYRGKIPRIPDNTFSQIIVIYSGEEELIGSLTELEKKAVEGKTRIAFVMNVRRGRKKLYDSLLNHYSRLSLLLYGDVFGESVDEENLVSAFLNQARSHGMVVVPNNGLYQTYPIAFQDVISGIITAVFIKALEKRVYFLFPLHPVTALSLARTIQSLDPLITTDFLQTDEPSITIALPEKGEYVTRNPYPLRERLKHIPLTRTRRAAPQHTRKRKTLRLPHPFLLLLPIFVFLLLPIVLPVVFALTGFLLLSNMQQSIARGDFTKVEKLASFAQNAFTLAAETSGGIGFLATHTGQSSSYSAYRKSLEAAGDVALLGQELVNARKNWDMVQGGAGSQPKEAFLKALQSLRQSAVLVKAIRANPHAPPFVTEKIEPYLPFLDLFTATSEVYPSLFGFNGKKTYLVLLQNNMELRPGGGFIGSYGLMNLENGRMMRFTIHNVYDADGQMKAHVEPPVPLRRYLGTEHLFLRDSNFSIDFVKNAAQAAYLLELETGEKVDGVLALDTNLLRDLLSVTGPVNLPLYNQTITTDNFYPLTQRYAEKAFFPGSRQKQDFLESVFTGLEAKLRERSLLTNPQLLVLAANAFRQRHAQFVVSDPHIQNVLTIAGISGTLWDGRETGDGIINDSFGLSEANIGQNKSNYYLERSYSHKVRLFDSRIAQEVTVQYRNTAKKGSEFGGSYSSYVQIVLPKDSKLESIAIDGKEQAIVPAVADPLRFDRASFVPPEGLEVAKEEVGELVVHGFFFVVPEEQEKKLTIRVSREYSQDLKDITYSLLIRKQAGTGQDPYVVSLSYPQAFRLIEKDVKFTERGKELVWFGPFTSDYIFVSRLSR